jgi:hypothetical protein
VHLRQSAVVCAHRCLLVGLGAENGILEARLNIAALAPGMASCGCLGTCTQRSESISLLMSSLFKPCVQESIATLNFCATILLLLAPVLNRSATHYHRAWTPALSLQSRPLGNPNKAGTRSDSRFLRPISAATMPTTHETLSNLLWRFICRQAVPPAWPVLAPSPNYKTPLPPRPSPPSSSFPSLPILTLSCMQVAISGCLRSRMSASRCCGLADFLSSGCRVPFGPCCLPGQLVTLRRPLRRRREQFLILYSSLLR